LRNALSEVRSQFRWLAGNEVPSTGARVYLGDGVPTEVRREEVGDVTGCSAVDRAEEVHDVLRDVPGMADRGPRPGLRVTRISWRIDRPSSTGGRAVVSPPSPAEEMQGPTAVIRTIEALCIPLLYTARPQTVPGL
jgi:hypothetical protein